MVDDVIFYTVLIILIAFVAFFLAFMVWLKSKFPHPLMMKVLSTLHSALFGYEKALVELIGSRGYKSHVFPEIVNTIKNIKDEDPRILELFSATTAKEAMEKWLEVLKVTGITQNGQIKEINENEFEIIIPDCSLHDPIHEIIGDQKGICPMALILASASAVGQENGKVPEMNYSEFHPTGTTTKLKFVNE
ncbi:MAG: hypothetical protein GF317_03135 [Candidatus Lokiarchaeota archaeon]|nr:hypothetical protein [Candidatus Lokiarchaeota archaeon]MBD3198902.1 hypothetical protein [Candidatus Lokiarchaeota archaeon]